MTKYNRVGQLEGVPIKGFVTPRHHNADHYIQCVEGHPMPLLGFMKLTANG